MYQEPYADGHLQDLPRETPLEGLKWIGWQLSNFVVGAFWKSASALLEKRSW